MTSSSANGTPPYFSQQRSLRKLARLLALCGVLAFLFTFASPDDDESQLDFLAPTSSRQSSVLKSRGKVSSFVRKWQVLQIIHQPVLSHRPLPARPEFVVGERIRIRCCSIENAAAGDRAPPPQLY